MSDFYVPGKSKVANKLIGAFITRAMEAGVYSQGDARAIKSACMHMADDITSVIGGMQLADTREGAQLRLAMEELTKTASSLRETNVALTSRVADAESKTRADKTRIQQLEASIATGNEKLKQLTERMEFTSGMLTGQTNETVRVKQQIDALQASINTTNAQHKKAIDDYKADYKHLRDMYAQLDAEHRALIREREASNADAFTRGRSRTKTRSRSRSQPAQKRVKTETGNDQPPASPGMTDSSSSSSSRGSSRSSSPYYDP